MFNNPGTKIKNLAKTFFWIEMIGVIVGILAMADDLFEEPIAAIGVLVGGFCVAYISALFLAAFGELVETNTQIKESNDAILAKLNVKGAVLLGILSTSIIYYLSTWTMPNLDMGSLIDPFKDFAEIGITGVFRAESWQNAFSGEMLGSIFSVIMLIITFCLVDMFDTIGTLYGAAAEADMLDENGDPVDVEKSMTCDSVATVTGAVCGTSTVTTFVECSSGVAAGGRTGLTSLVTALCFALCLFLSPLASIIPTAATAPALIFVGVLMIKNFAKVDMEDMRSAVPAFLTLVMMPLTYSIANGIGIGAISYVLLTLFSGNFKKRDITVTVIAILFACKFLFGAI